MNSRKTTAPMLVGLCGRSGSGKGYVSEKFLVRGIPSVDTDAVYRTLTAPSDTLSPCMKELCERFGDSVRNEDNSLNRAVMRSLVFGGDAEALDDLNRITHAHILRETKKTARRLYKEGNDIVLIDAPLLYESGFDKFCAAVVAVTAPEEKIISRIMRRDGVTREQAEARLRTQKPVSELTDRADYVIVNGGVDNEMEKQLDECVRGLCDLYCNIKGKTK